MKTSIGLAFPGSIMRTGFLAATAAGLLLAGTAGALGDEPGKTTEAERITRLIEQLGDDAFANREAAEKELSAIGGPALAPLKAAATGSDDPEIQLRAERLAAAIHREIPKRALAGIEGTWVRQTAESNGKAAPKDDPPIRYTFKDGSVEVIAGEQVLQQAKWIVVEAAGDQILVDYSITAGVNQGHVVRGVYTLNGNEMRWCYSFAPNDRPTEFATRPGDNNSLVTLKREKP